MKEICWFPFQNIVSKAKKMTTIEQREYVSANFPNQLSDVQNALEIAEFRDVESIIDKINDPVFTRYCVTLLIDELISFETAELSEED
jgi:hypothetical protein